jgi:hypothetical protein
MGERVRKSFKEGDDRGKGGDVGGRSTRAERSDVDVATVGYNQNILESVDRTDGKATGEVGGRPLVLVDGEGATPQRQRVNKRRGEGGGLRGRGRYIGGEWGK